MKKLLVPTDFSANAFNALVYALKLAESQQASVELLHVFHPPVVDISTSAEVLPELIEISEKQAAQSFEALKTRLREEKIVDLEKLSITYTNKMGFPVDIISQLSQKSGYDLIIMGTKGASGLKEVFWGSNTSQVIHKVKTPVLAVPEKAHFHPLKKIAYATDLVLGDSQALSQLLGFAISLRAHIRCFHIHNSKLQVEEGILDEMSERFKEEVEQGLIRFELIESNNINEGIQQFVEEHEIDVLAMLTKKRYFLDYLLNRSLTEKMTFHARVPILAFHQ